MRFGFGGFFVCVCSFFRTPSIHRMANHNFSFKKAVCFCWGQYVDLQVSCMSKPFSPTLGIWLIIYRMMGVEVHHLKGNKLLNSGLHIPFRGIFRCLEWVNFYFLCHLVVQLQNWTYAILKKKYTSNSSLCRNAYNVPVNYLLSILVW